MINGKQRWGLAVPMATGLLVLSGCGAASTPTASASGSTPVSLVTNWFPEPEQAGQYAALLNGDYKKHGLKMKVEPGGPQVSAIPLVASGKVTFGISSADSLLEARQKGIPVVAVFATFQTDPQVLIYHKNAGVHSFASMNGHPVYVSAAADYWSYISSKYHLTVRLMNYTGSLSPFEQNPRAIIQGYATEEPYTLKQHHVAIGYKMVSSSGFNPYQNVLFTTQQEIKNHPQVVRDVVAATEAGWKQYFQNPGPTNSLLKKDSPSLTDGGMKYAASHEKSLIEPRQGPRLGTMTATRWNVLARQMKGLGLLSHQSVVKGAYTNRFLPGS